MKYRELSVLAKQPHLQDLIRQAAFDVSADILANVASTENQINFARRVLTGRVDWYDLASVIFTNNSVASTADPMAATDAQVKTAVSSIAEAYGRALPRAEV